jgi:hypothetical protein
VAKHQREIEFVVPDDFYDETLVWMKRKHLVCDLFTDPVLLSLWDPEYTAILVNLRLSQSLAQWMPSWERFRAWAKQNKVTIINDHMRRET